MNPSISTKVLPHTSTNDDIWYINYGEYKSGANTKQ